MSMRRWTFPVVSTLLCVMALCADARAQVNVEALRYDYLDAPAKAQLEGSFAGRIGNARSVIAGGAAIGGAQVRRHAFFGSVQGDYSRFNEATNIARSFVHLRYSYRWLDWLWTEAFVQQQQDRIQRLRLRELVGAGPRFVVLDAPDLRVAVGTGAMFEYERISVAEGAADPPTSTAYRSSSYLTTTWQLDGTTRALGTVYVQPRWDALEDVRALVESTVMSNLGKRLALKLIVTVRYDSAPPTTVKTMDAEVKNALVLRF